MRLIEEGKLDEARTAGTTCLKDTPKKKDCHEAIVRSYILGGSFGMELRAAATTCLEAVPDLPACMWGLGMQSLKNSSYTDALDILQRLKATAPESTEAIVLQADYQQEMKDEKRACLGFREACTLGDGYACKKSEACAAGQSEPQKPAEK